MANILEPKDLAVRRIEKRHPIAIEVEWRVVNALRVALGLRQHVLRAESDFLRLDNTKELAVNNERVIGGAICRRKLFNRMATIPAQRFCWIERRDLPAPLLQAGIDPALSRAPFAFR